MEHCPGAKSLEFQKAFIELLVGSYSVLGWGLVHLSDPEDEGLLKFCAWAFPSEPSAVEERWPQP